MSEHITNTAVRDLFERKGLTQAAVCIKDVVDEYLEDYLEGKGDWSEITAERENCWRGSFSAKEAHIKSEEDSIEDTTDSESADLINCDQTEEVESCVRGGCYFKIFGI